MTEGPGIPEIGTVAVCNGASDVIQVLRGQLATKPLRRLAGEIHVNAGTLSAVLRGKREPTPALYIALGLTPPVRVVEVPAGYDIAKACTSCGKVHTTKACVKRRKPRRTVRDRFARFMMPGDW